MATKPVTDAELSEIADRVLDLIEDLRDVENRVEKHIGMAPDVQAPIRYALKFATLSSAAARVSRAILIVAANAEDRALLEAELKAKRASENKGASADRPAASGRAFDEEHKP